MLDTIRRDAGLRFVWFIVCAVAVAVFSFAGFYFGQVYQSDATAKTVTEHTGQIKDIVTVLQAGQEADSRRIGEIDALRQAIEATVRLVQMERDDRLKLEDRVHDIERDERRQR